MVLVSNYMVLFPIITETKRDPKRYGHAGLSRPSRLCVGCAEDDMGSEGVCAGVHEHRN